MSTIFRQPTARERWTGVAIEFLPLLILPYYFVLAFAYGADDVPSGFVGPVFVAAWATGVGWSLLGRWDIGCAAAFAHVFVVLAAVVASLVLFGPCITDGCSERSNSSWDLARLFFVAGYALLNLISPMALVLALHREPSWRGSGARSGKEFTDD